jgi:hypothetical protein
MYNPNSAVHTKRLSGLQPRYRDVFINDRRGTPRDEHFFA